MLQTVVNPYNSLYMACCYLIKIYFKNWGRTNQSTVVVQNSYEWVTWACTASKCMAAETDPLGWWKGLRVQQCLVKINQVQSLTYESVAALSVHWLRPTVYVGDGINGCELPLQFRYTVTLRQWWCIQEIFSFHICSTVWLAVPICLLSSLLTCWNPSQSPALPLHGPDAEGGARRCLGPWSFQRVGSKPDVEWKKISFICM